MDRDVFDKICHAMNALGFHVQNVQVRSTHGTYELELNAIQFKDLKTNHSYFPVTRAPAVPKAKVCECGAAKTGGIHSSWCPLTDGTKP